MILKITLLIIFFMVIHTSLCFICGFKNNFVRAKNENNCCFNQNNKCNFILWRWFFPCWLYKKMNNANLFCPFCYDDAFSSAEYVSSFIVKQFFHRLALILLAIAGSVIVFVLRGW